VKCNNKPCTRLYCTFAHNDLELQAWNNEKQEVLNCKLYNLFDHKQHYCKYFFTDNRPLPSPPVPQAHRPVRDFSRSYSYLVS